MRYAGRAIGVNTGADVGIINLISATTIRPKLYEIIIGSDATPADQATNYTIERTTAVGTEAGGFTPVALDPGDGASRADCGLGTYSVEPTKTANSELLCISLNQRATFRWVASPRGEIIAPATASNGLLLNSLTTTSAHACDATFHWEE